MCALNLIIFTYFAGLSENADKELEKPDIKPFCDVIFSVSLNRDVTKESPP